MYEEAAASLISELAKSTVSSMTRKMKGVWDSSDFKVQQELINSYESYLVKSKEKNSKIKTLLYRRNPVNLYSFYESINVTLEKESVSTKDIRNLLSISKRILITGTGGVGKSTMVKHLFLNCVENQCYVPIIIELRSFNDIKEKINFDYFLKHVYETINYLGFESEEKYFVKGLELGENLLIFDGLDEVTKGLSDSLIKSIKEFSDIFSNCPVIVTSRPSDEFIGWNDFVEMEAQLMNKDQALSLIKKLEFDEEIKNRFYELLDKELYDKYSSFASIPLLLTIMLITFENNASIPEELNDFYEKAFSALFNTHDASKSGYKREIESKIGYDDFKNIFSHICFKSYFKDDIEFNEDKILDYISQAIKHNGLTEKVKEGDFLRDLTHAVCMLIKDGLNYKFSHRSFQEYFAAVYTTKLDDKFQEIIFKEVFKKQLMFFENKYLKMFREMQKDRFIKNAIYPHLKIFLDNSKSVENVFQETFDSLIEHDGKAFLSVGHNVNRLILKLCEDLFGYSFYSNSEKLNSILDIAKQNRLENGKKVDELPRFKMKELNSLHLIRPMVDAVDNFENTINGLREWIKEYENQASSVNGELSQILDLI